MTKCQGDRLPSAVFLISLQLRGIRSTVDDLAGRRHTPKCDAQGLPILYSREALLSTKASRQEESGALPGEEVISNIVSGLTSTGEYSRESLLLASCASAGDPAVALPVIGYRFSAADSLRLAFDLGDWTPANDKRYSLSAQFVRSRAALTSSTTWGSLGVRPRLTRGWDPGNRVRALLGRSSTPFAVVALPVVGWRRLHLHRFSAVVN